MKILLLIVAGGALGAVGRHLAGQAFLRAIGPDWPYGTFAVNVIGGLAMGLFIGWLALAQRADANELRAFFAVGLLGGFTTFSAFSLDVVVMLERRAILEAAGYIAASVVLSILALFAGLLIMRRVMS